MASDTKQFITPRMAVTGLFSFLLIGGSLGLYGPALPGFTTRFGLEPGTAGIAISVHNVGAVLGILSAIPIAHFPSLARRRVGMSLLFLTVGGLLAGISPYWSLTLGGIFFYRISVMAH